MALTPTAVKRLIRIRSPGLTHNRAVLSSSSSTSRSDPRHRIHLVFGANTDVGKSVVSAGLVRAAAAASKPGVSVNYIKPLQCGGSDESFIMNYRCSKRSDTDISCTTLFSWETPASPHLASRVENLPVSDEEVLSSLQSCLYRIEERATRVTMDREYEMRSITVIETAGGVLSPSSSSPLNKHSHNDVWGWSTQADLYTPTNIPVVFVGDGRLGGISVSLASLEALWSRGYRVDALVFIEDFDKGGSIRFGRENATAVLEHISKPSTVHLSKARPDDFELIHLPPLPQLPDPLNDWYERTEGEFLNLHDFLCRRWKGASKITD